MTLPDQPLPSGFDPSQFNFDPASPDSLASRLAEDQQKNATGDSPLMEVAGNVVDFGCDVASEGAGAVIEGAAAVAGAGMDVAGQAAGAVAEVGFGCLGETLGGCFSGCCVLLVLLFLGASTVLAYVW